MGSTVSSTVSRMLGARRKLVRATASNFYYAFLLLPRAERRAIKDVYAFCRLLDDVVDEDQTVRPTRRGVTAPSSRTAAAVRAGSMEWPPLR